MTDEFATKLDALLKIQPAIITNDRLKRPNYPGDFKTPEQKIPNLSELDGKDWETCMTMNKTWGFNSNDHNWKSSETLIRNLIDIASKGGNYLLNIGPKADGEFPQESIERLKEIGKWMKLNGDAIYGTHASGLKPVSWGRFTQKENRGNSTLYISVFEWPADRKLHIEGLKNEIQSVGMLANGQKLKYNKSADILTIQLPENTLNLIVPVIKLDIKGKSEITVSNEPKKKMKTGELD